MKRLMGILLLIGIIGGAAAGCGKEGGGSAETPSSARITEESVGSEITDASGISESPEMPESSILPEVPEPSAPAVGETLYHFAPDRIQKIEVRTGDGMRNILQRGDRTEDAMLEVIESLNQFVYVETEVVEEDRVGWYVQLNLVDDDGTEQDVMVSIGAAFDIGVSGGDAGDIVYISDDPDYFGSAWHDLVLTPAYTDIEMWAEPYILALFRRGRMEGFREGISDNEFHPEEGLSRISFLALLEETTSTWRSNNWIDPDAVEGDDHYEDFPKESWLYRTALLLAKEGILPKTPGEPENFYPDEGMTREDAAGILTRYLNHYHPEIETQRVTEEPSFTFPEDAPEDFQREYRRLYEMGIVGNEGKTVIEAQGDLTRGEGAEIFANLEELLLAYWEQRVSEEASQEESIVS